MPFLIFFRKAIIIIPMTTPMELMIVWTGDVVISFLATQDATLNMWKQTDQAFMLVRANDLIHKFTAGGVKTYLQK